MEKFVVERVRKYLGQLRQKLPVPSSTPTDLYSITTEYTIQIGSSKCRADVVLLKEDLPLIWGTATNRLIVIVEAKAVGKAGDGIEQLQSYLCATDTRFGIFAASLDPNKWQYYENHQRNNFQLISRPEFEKRVLREIDEEQEAENRIKQAIDSHRRRLEKKLDNEYKEKKESLQNEYKEKEESLQATLQTRLKEERREGFKNGFWVGVSAVVFIIVVIAIASGG